MKKLFNSLLMFLILVPAKALFRSLLDMLGPIIVSSLASHYVHAAEPKNLPSKRTIILVVQLVVSGISIIILLRTIKQLVKRLKSKNAHYEEEHGEHIDAGDTAMPLHFTHEGHPREIVISLEDNPQQTHITLA